MMRSTTKMLKDGRVTVPSPIREKLELEHGDFVEIEIRRIDEVDG